MHCTAGGGENPKAVAKLLQLLVCDDALELLEVPLVLAWHQQPPPTAAGADAGADGQEQSGRYCEDQGVRDAVQPLIEWLCQEEEEEEESSEDEGNDE